MQAKDGLSRRSTFLLLALVVVIGTIVGTVYTLWRLRAEAIDRHLEAASMYARAFEDHLTQSVKVIDLILVNAVANVGDEARETVVLSAALHQAPYLRSLSLLDAQGAIVASSDSRNVGIRVAREHFLPPGREPRSILRGGLPLAGRDFYDARAIPENLSTAEAQSLIPVLRDVAIGGDAWATLLASVNTDYFLNYYARSLAAGAGVVEVLRYDGILLLSTDAGWKPGTRDTSAMLSGRLATEEFGRFEQRLDDGREMLTAYRASRAFPFVVVVHLDKRRGLVDWRREAWRTVIVVFGVLSAALSLATLYFVRIERAARQHDADVERLRVLGAALEAAANAIIITDQKGRIEWANPAFCALSGYTLEEALGQNPRDLVKSGTQLADGYRDLWRTILAGKVWRGEMINRRKDNTHYLEDQTITPVLDSDGSIRHFIAVKQDITERRRSEEKMKELSHHLVAVQESARRRLSGELHDRTSPNLAAIGVNLDIIAQAMAAEQSPMLAERLADVRALIEDTAASIREISSELRPPVLDHGGLLAALDSYAKQFKRRTGMAVRIDCAHPAARLAAELESALFRLVQEALTNCAKHSRARSIAVALRLDGPLVTLTVTDDGIGFDPESLGKTTPARGLGILTMREMAEFLGGHFSIESAPRKGTRVKVEIESSEGQG